jgi:hypothetical protein
MPPVAQSTRAKTVFVRVFVGHLVAYPVAAAWAFGSVPALIAIIASRYGLTLEEKEIVHRVLWGLAVPVGVAALLEHLAGVVWGVDRNERRGKRIFIAATVVLLAVPILGGAASWIWLMTRSP